MSTTQITLNGDELQALVQQGPEALRATFVRICNEAMKLERQQFLGAEPRKHHPQRRGRANGYQAERLHTPAGQVTVAVPKTRDHPPGESFYPASLTRGRRVTRAVAAIRKSHCVDSPVGHRADGCWHSPIIISHQHFPVQNR